MTLVAGTTLRRGRDEMLVGALLLQAVQHACLGGDDDVLGRGLPAPGDHLFGGADFVGQHPHRSRALGVGHDRSSGILLANPGDGLMGPLDMHVAIALPKGHWSPRLLHHPSSEVLVGHEQQRPILRCMFNNLDRIAAGHDAVAQSLHLGRTVDVGDGVEIGIRGLEFPQLGSRATLFEGATGITIRENDPLGGIQDLGRFGHEVHPAEDNDIGRGLGRLLGQPQGIAYEIGHILNLRRLVVVGQDHRVVPALQLQDLPGKGIKLRRRHRLADRSDQRIGRVNHGGDANPQTPRCQGPGRLGQFWRQVLAAGLTLAGGARGL